MSSNKSLLSILTFLHLLCFCTVAQGRSAGCGKALPSGLSPGGPSKNFTMYSKAGGGTRRYLVHLPEGFSSQNDKPAQLILAFHGQTQPTASLETMSGFSDPFFNREFIVVYPEGLNYEAPGHQWLGDPEAPPSSVIDDRLFVNDLLDTLTSTFCIDEDRIHAAGFSNGGGLVGLLACSPLLNRRIAAFAVVAGAFYTDASLTEPLFGKGCQPDLTTRKRIPIMSFHGTVDDVIAYDGDNSPAPNTIPIFEWARTWATRHDCAIQGPRVLTWSAWTAMLGFYCLGDGDANTGVVDVMMFYRMANVGHGWPSTVSLDGNEAGRADLNATRHIMLFFEGWNRNGWE